MVLYPPLHGTLNFKDDPMKIRSNLILFFLLHGLLLLFVACEEVIDIHLNSSKPVLVAEGVIYKDSVAQLRLAMTSDYFDNETAPVIEDAIVTLTDNEGNIEKLQHTENGIYLGDKMRGKVGRTYFISFFTNGKTYSATTKLFAPVNILNTSVVEEREWKFGGSSTPTIEYSMEVSFSYNPENESFFMLKYWNNDIKIGNRYFLERDVFAKENIVESSLRTFDLVKGNYTIVVFSIDENTYKYYRQLNEIGQGGMRSATPYNPFSNFGKEVMGYFTASSFSVIKGDF